MNRRLLPALCALLLTLPATASADSSRALVRVTAVSAFPARMSAAPARARLSAGDLTVLHSRVVSPVRRRAIAASAASRQSTVLRDTLKPLMAENRRRLRRLLPHVRALGGRLVAADGMFGTLTVSIA